MSEGIQSRAHGLIGARSPVEPLPRGIQTEHVRFVAANRHRMGWQTMVNILKVNVNDLRRHCDKAFASTLPPAPQPTPPPPKARWACDPLLVLQAVQRGAVSYEDVSEVCQIGRIDAVRMIARVRQGGLIALTGMGNGWQLTGAGSKALRRGRVDDDV